MYIKNIRILAYIIGIALLLTGPAIAIYLTDLPTSLRQPNGKVLNLYTSGDEFYHWVHDVNGYVVVQNNKTGYYVYAIRQNGDIVPSKYVVGKVNPANVGLEPNIKPSPKKLEEKIQGRELANPLPVELSNEMVSQSTQARTINNLFVFVRFAGEAEFIGLRSTYNDMLNNTTAGVSSMHNYFLEISYNNLTVNSTLYPTATGDAFLSYQDLHPRNYYQPYNSATNPSGYKNETEMISREHMLVKSASEAIASQVPADLIIDSDNDGKVDNISLLINGISDVWGYILWPHEWYLGTQTTYINGKQVWNYSYHIKDIADPCGVSVFSHEFLHTLDVPDMYHYSKDEAALVGPWDVLQWPRNPPQHISAYLKFRYAHWISEIPEITTSGVYTLNPLTSPTNNCYKIRSPYSTTEYFVVEYRKKAGTFESSLPGSGLIVYRINTAADDGHGNMNGPPDEVYVYRPAAGMDYANFSSDVGRTQINDTTDPRPFLSNGAPGGLDISEIGSAGDTISFRVNGIQQPSPVSTPDFNPDGGVYTSPLSVAITCSTTGAVIHYTTNGQDPTEGDLTIVSGNSLSVTQTLTLKAKAWKTGMNPSEIKSAAYIIQIPSEDRIYVDKRAAGSTHDGLSWQTAFLNVGDALSHAVSGQEIWVAAGSYSERITLKDGVRLYGGFAGTESLLTQRDWRINITTLDGGFGGSVVTVPSNAGANTRIDGFIIRNGNAYCGGGIFCSSGSAPVIANNRVLRNNATYGGGIWIDRASAVVMNNEIAENSAYSQGAGVCTSLASPVIANNLIGGNTVSSTNGGAIDTNGGSPCIYNNTITENSRSGLYLLESNAIVVNNIIELGTYGIYMTGGSTTLRNNCVYGNSTNYIGLTAGIGDISEDPKFANRAALDFHLLSTSPCINKGDDTIVQSDWQDLDSQTRISGTHVDIGVDEYVTP